MTRTLRVARDGDLDAILRIENESFGNPWPRDAYQQELERRHGVVRVATSRRAGIVAFSCTWHVQIEQGAESHLLRIAVAPAHRGVGVGAEMMDALIAHAHALGSSHVTLEVASANKAAVGLYQSCGFREIARRVAYYRSPPDDALVLRRELQERHECDDP